MGRFTFAALVVTALLTAASPLVGIYIGVESRRVPVARLVANLVKRLADNPRDAELHVKLARLYGLASATNAEELPARTDRNGIEEAWFGHEPGLIPGPESPAGGSRTEAARNFLKKSLQHYRAALDLNPDHLVARLGLAWALEQSSNKVEAIAVYRDVVGRAWPKERSVKFGELGQRFFTSEAAERLIPLLDPKPNAEEIADLRKRVAQLDRVPRPITPIAIPLRDDVEAADIVDLDARVRFDADGSGHRRPWTWISADAAWLVYDADGRGEISSALQWFGEVSFWLFWQNGYEALSALDDDGDSELRGEELRYLKIWQDRNRNGSSDRGEVETLRQHGITALSCRFSKGDGLLTAALSQPGVRLESGRTRPTYDVILRPAWSVSAPPPE